MSERKYTTYKVTATVSVPRVPNFLIMENGQKISITDVNTDALREIGRLWTEALVERAAEIHRQRINEKAEIRAEKVDG